MAKLWDERFCPSFTPEEMLDMGVFEGIYTHAIKGLPKSWYNKPKVLKKGEEPDISLNYYGVKARQSLKEWRDKGWTTKDSPLGWWQWYCLYWLGRRIPKEDDLQIGRWNSYVARHQGQINANCSLKDGKCRMVQRQSLLQWAWDSTTLFDDKQKEKNLKRLAKLPEVSLENAIIVPPSMGW